MKKVLALLLAVVMVIGMTTASLAAEQTGNPTNGNQTMPANVQNTVKIKKTYKASDADAISPAETVAFTWEKTAIAEAGIKPGTTEAYTVDNMPNLTAVTLAAYAEKAATVAGYEAYVNVTLPVYDAVGIYTYTITETDGNMAGVTYGANKNPIKLVVTVTQGTDGLLVIAAIHTEASTSSTKTDSFENTYDAGKLAVSKTVSGNMGDKNKYFDFKVTFTAPTGDTVGADITVSGGTESSNPKKIDKGWTGSKEVTFKLKDGDTLTFANIPAGVTYTVTETAAEGYTTTQTGESGTIAKSATATAAFTNTKTGTVDTGIVLDSLPYILIGVAVAAAVVLMVAKKRRIED